LPRESRFIPQQLRRWYPPTTSYEDITLMEDVDNFHPIQELHCNSSFASRMIESCAYNSEECLSLQLYPLEYLSSSRFNIKQSSLLA